jgi:hypothetical protein
MAENLARICIIVALMCVPVCLAVEKSSTNCLAKLPDGTTVELVGMRCLSHTLPEGFEGDRGQWWRPDGTVLPEPPDNARTQTGWGDTYVLAIRLGGRLDGSLVAVGPWGRDMDSSNVWLKGPSFSEEGDWRAFVLRFGRDQKIADVRIGVATGLWTLVQDWPAPGDGTPDSLTYVSEDEVILRCPVQSGSEVVAEVTHGFAEEATRLLIVDQDGRPHTPTNHLRGHGGGLVQYVHHFKDLQIDAIKRIQFHKRPYNCWITFRDISLRPGQKTQVQAEIEQKSTGLTGRSLPRFNVAQIDAAVENAKGKRILLCFWDVGQRPSRNCFQQLAKERDALESKGVSIIPVHIATGGDRPAEEWLEKNHIPLLTETLGDNRAQARQIWGVDVLPWLVLTDNNHNVTAEGFPLSELNQKLDTKGDTKKEASERERL